MKKTFYILVLLALCSTLGFAADSALHQAHRANAFGIMNNEETDPERMRVSSGLDFDTQNPVVFHDKGNKGPTKNYTVYKADGTGKKVAFDPSIPQPSEAVDATNEEEATTNSSTASKNEQPPAPTTNTQVKTQQKTYKYLKPEEQNLPTAKKDRLEKSRSQAAKRKAEEEKWVDPITQAKTQEEVREILQKEWLTPELKQVLKGYGVSEDEFIDRMIASHKEYQRSDYKPKQTDKQQAQNNTADEDSILPMTQGMRAFLTVKGIKPENLKKANNQPVNNQVKNTKKFKLAADIIKADQRLSEKEKQEFLEWDAKIRRQAEELKEQERLEQERKNRELEEQARNQYMDSKKHNANAEDVKYGKFEQICDPEIKNSSSAACAMCCFHPKTYLSKFNPDTQVMTDGYIDSRDNQCHCTWQGKPLTGYDTRNTSQQACNAYCLAHPEDTKGFNPEKHQMHYGRLKKGECKCHYIKKDVDICSWKTSTSSDEACSRCCIEQPERNRNNAPFNPSIHTMLGGHVSWPGESIRYCDCTWKTKPEMQADEHAAVTGASVDAPAPAYGDDAYTTAVCDQNFVHKTNGNCTKCCLAKQPQAPRAGYKLDFGYLNNGRCKCHFSNPNADVCDNERKLASDYGCYRCCEAQPPANFDPNTDEMDYGRVVGNNCECHWKTRPQQTYDDDDGPGCSFEEKNRSQYDCNRCCTDPAHGLVGGELESDGICVCLHR